MNAPRPITGRMVLIGFLAFFGVIFAVNGVFVYFALDSWPGLRFEKAYERGLNYNRVLSEAETQAELKWTSSVSVVAAGSGAHQLSVRLNNASQVPIAGSSVRVTLSRPTNDGNDVTLELAPSKPGEYIAVHRFTADGRWHAALTINGQGGESYKMIHDIIVKP